FKPASLNQFPPDRYTSDCSPGILLIISAQKKNIKLKLRDEDPGSLLRLYIGVAGIKKKIGIIIFLKTGKWKG
ncbi:hypothetical protein COY52_12525, partial [Candidatus Desantisbacteria bacterium CG_4_10_14_0_8_um_filter_48_22]